MNEKQMIPKQYSSLVQGVGFAVVMGVIVRYIIDKELNNYKKKYNLTEDEKNSLYESNKSYIHALATTKSVLAIALEYGLKVMNEK